MSGEPAEMSTEASASRRMPAGYGAAVAAVGAATAICWFMFGLFEPANLIMTYLLAIVGVAARYGRAPSVAASALSVAAFDFFFVPPDRAIRVIATAAGGKFTIEVADDGPGLPQGEEERVFEKFHRAAAADGQRGAGLGLAICRGIVEAHGGRIWAQNLPEGGVAFLFTLPMSQAPPVPLPIEA